jgi:hypothetical protein
LDFGIFFFARVFVVSKVYLARAASYKTLVPREHQTQMGLT